MWRKQQSTTGRIQLETDASGPSPRIRHVVIDGDVVIWPGQWTSRADEARSKATAEHILREYCKVVRILPEPGEPLVIGPEKPDPVFTGSVRRPKWHGPRIEDGVPRGKAFDVDTLALRELDPSRERALPWCDAESGYPEPHAFEIPENLRAKCICGRLDCDLACV